MEKVIRQVPMFARAEAKPTSVDEETRTVDLVFSTAESRVRRIDWETLSEYDEELSLDPEHVRMDRLLNGAPLLDSHRAMETKAVIGVVEHAEVDGTEGRARVRFHTGDSLADGIFSKVKSGILRNISVGYRVHKLEEVQDGGDGRPPVMRATDWEPMELSVVAVGADPGARVRADSQPLNRCEFISPIAERKDIIEMKNEKQNETAVEKDETRGAGPEIKTPEKTADEIRAEERERTATIYRTAKTLGLDDDFADKHIDGGTELDAFRKAAFDAYAKAKPSQIDDVRVEAVKGGDDGDKFARQMEDWILVRSGVSSKLQAAAKRKKEPVPQFDPGLARGESFMGVADRCLERQGVNVRGRTQSERIELALRKRTGYAATGDFAVILANVTNKSMLGGLALTEDTWRNFCAIGSVSDFRVSNRYRIGSFGALDTVLEGAEYTHKSIADGRKETIQIAKRGNIIGVTREMLVNDDMGAFISLASAFGRAAGLSIEVAVYASLAENSGLGPDMTDATALFDATHGNVNGTGSALSSAGIQADRAVMKAQQDENSNEYLDLRPSVLLIPTALYGTAVQINSAQFDPDSAGDLAPNITNGMFDVIVDTPRISGLRRYIFADPAIAPVFEVAFLDGRQEPYLTEREGFDIDGIEWKVRHEFGVSAVDYLGCVTNAGS